MEKLDRILLKFIFNVPDSVPSIALYLESGCLTIGTLIKARRVNFLHTLANREDSEMHTKFFQHQWDHPSKLDWTEQVRKDLLDLGMPVSLEFAKSKSKEVFSNLVKKEIRKFELRRLVNKKKSKMVNLEYSELTMQNYLELKTMNRRQAIILFKFRVRMTPFKENFKAGEDRTLCPLCSLHVDSQGESFTCSKITAIMEVKGKYHDIFGSKFSPELTKTLENIYLFRDEYRKLTS